MSGDWDPSAENPPPKNHGTIFKIPWYLSKEMCTECGRQKDGKKERQSETRVGQTMKQVDLREPYLGCKQRECKSNLKTAQENKDSPESLISTGTFKQLLDGRDSMRILWLGLVMWKDM